MTKRQVSFFIGTELWKEFSKKCIDLDKSKTSVLIDLMENFVLCTVKRKSVDLQKEIFNIIKENPGITMTSLERKIGTNPASLKLHCENLQHFKLIKIVKEEKTTKLYSL